MKRTLSRTCIIIVLLLFQIFLTALGFGETPKPAAGVSPCRITTDMVGQTVSVFGQIAFITHDNPEGSFAELEAEGCKVGVFIPSRISDQWDKQQREMLYLGAQLLVSGLLVSFDGKLIIDVSEAPQAYVSDENASETSKSEDASAQDSIPESSLDLPPAPNEAQLDVPIIYSGYGGMPGLCYLGAAAMLVKYHHPGIDFADVVAFSGVGSSALHLDFPEISMLSTRLADQSIVYMANNIGASYVLGYERGGTGSDPFYPVSLAFEDHATHLVSFKDGEDALDFLVRAVGSGYPVMVYLNLYYVYDDFSQSSDFWRRYLGKDKASHYMTVTGFQHNTIIINDPTDPTEAATSLTTSTENFVQAWEETLDFSDAPPLGPYWMLFFDDPGSVPEDTTVINLNVESGTGAPSEIRSFAKRLDVSEGAFFLLSELANARLKFADYLERNGWLDAARNYRSSGALLARMVTERRTDPLVLNEVAALEETALASLAERSK